MSGLSLGLGLSFSRPLSRFTGFSAEAQDYFDRLDTALDVTYPAYKQPLANYIDALVALGGAYWDDMESAASFVGVGIQGVVVPLRNGMPTITNNMFIDDDLDQLTGLKGDGSSKYLDTGTIGTDYAQDDASLSVYLNGSITMSGSIAGDATVSGGMYLRRGASTNLKHSNHGAAQTTVGALNVVGIAGTSRSGSTGYTRRSSGAEAFLAQTSVPVVSTNSIFIFKGSPPDSSSTDARLATYHVGASLDLSVLEGMQDTLISEIGAI